MPTEAHIMVNRFYGDPKDHPDNASLPNVNQPATIIGVTISMLSLAIIAMTLRLWVRVRDRLWSWDDAFVLLAGMSSTAGDCMLCSMPRDGLGLHLWTLDDAHLKHYFRLIYSTNVAYGASATFIKLAILFQYLRLFAETASTTTSSQYRLARRVAVFLIILSSLWGVTFFLLAVFPCKPITKYWDTGLNGTCIGWGSKDPDQFFPMFAAHSASNMFLDFLVLLAPVPFLRMLRLAGKSKAGVITLFTLGCIVCAVSIGRLVSLTVNRAGTKPRMDVSYHVPIVYLFSVLEVNIAIIAASIPIFWPVIATLTTNRIWVVNEIEVRVESTSRNSLSSNGEIGLSDPGSWGKIDKKDERGKSSRLSVLHKAYDRADTRNHRHKLSNASTIGRALGHDTGGRNSNESQRNLFPNTNRDVAGSSATLGRNERDEWLAEADRQNTLGTTTTKIETTEMPYEQIKKLGG